MTSTSIHDIMKIQKGDGVMETIKMLKTEKRAIGHLEDLFELANKNGKISVYRFGIQRIGLYKRSMNRIESELKTNLTLNSKDLDILLEYIRKCRREVKIEDYKASLDLNKLETLINKNYDDVIYMTKTLLKKES